SRHIRIGDVAACAAAIHLVSVHAILEIAAKASVMTGGGIIMSMSVVPTGNVVRSVRPTQLPPFVVPFQRAVGIAVHLIGVGNVFVGVPAVPLVVVRDIPAGTAIHLIGVGNVPAGVTAVHLVGVGDVPTGTPVRLVGVGDIPAGTAIHLIGVGQIQGLQVGAKRFSRHAASP